MAYIIAMNVVRDDSPLLTLSAGTPKLSLNVCFRGKADIEVKVFTSPFDQSEPQWHDLRIHDDAQHS
jgi:hypothetical protein